ncbi:MAG TPA: glycosyltransferase family 4 protein [Usitatibacter sp.]|jgi:glycosyltransferase involved in cell wall biosynthesis|nr:glycosyltransferase family 4 protein [Usitatibacter sp.]
MTDTRPCVLLVLEATFPREGGGGAESQVFTLARCLAARGLRIVVVVPRVAEGPQALRETIEHFEVVRIPYPRTRVLGGIVLLARLAALLVAWRGRYSAIHAHIAHNMAATSTVVGRLLGKPVFVKITGVHEIHGGILDPRPRLSVRLRRWALRRATRMQATSTRISRLLVDRGFGPAQVALLPNGVDTARFARRSRNAALRGELCGDAPRVGIFVGRLSPEKALFLLLDAWARAFDPRACLLLVGEGPLRDELGARARELGIASQVVFAGHRADVGDLLSTADFAILPSHGEGLSNALLEYMAAELPVVGSRVSGTEDFVEAAHGWLFEPGDGAGLERALRAVSAMPDADLRRMGLAARDRVESLASLDAVTGRLLSLYGLEPAGPLAAAQAA